MATKAPPTRLSPAELAAEYLNPDQQVAFDQATDPDIKYHLFYGGAGSGKTFLIMLIIIFRALGTNGSRHAVFRLTRNSCEQTLFLKTFFEVMEVFFPDMLTQMIDQQKISYSKLTVEFHNGSQIFFNGLDEHRLTKVLGDEFNSVWLNECNEDGLNYRTVGVLRNRLRSKRLLANGEQLVNKMFFDCNPRFYSDWEYKAFKLHVNPSDGDAMPRPHQWVSHKLRTEENLHNLGDDYVEGMETMASEERHRYLKGEWRDENNNALFTEKMINDARVPKPHHILSTLEHMERLDREIGLSPDINDTLDYLRSQDIDLQRITVSCDPAVTADPKSDLTGITVQGIAKGDDGGDHAYPLADYSGRYTPDRACQVIDMAFRYWGASRIIMEKNQGGLWLEATLLKHTRHVPKFVSATSTTGGKGSRAEPVAVQYERGRVHHVGKLKELEEQMCDFGSPASRRKSPDRMDALVWGITEILDLGIEKKNPPGVRMARRGSRLR